MTFRTLDHNLADQAASQPLDIDINNLLRKTPYAKLTEMRKVLDDGTSPAVPMIKDYQRSVKVAIKAMSAEPPKMYAGTNRPIPIRLRAEMATRYAAAVENLQQLISKGVLFCWISSHPDCSPRCAEYQGRLYSLFHGTVKVDGKEYGEKGTIDGISYRPINEALAGKSGDGNGCISGYNCRHRAIEYERGSKPPADYTEAEMKRAYAVDKRQRAYENQIRQLKTQEKLQRACGMKKEADAIRKKWQRLTDEYQIYSMDNRRAFYPYRCAIDEAEVEEAKFKKAKSLAENGNNTPPPYNRQVIDDVEGYRKKFEGLGNKSVVKALRREARVCIKDNDGTNNERGVFIDEKGNSLMKFSGKNSRAEFNCQELESYPNDSLVLVHNHPHSTSFSIMDILSLMTNPQIKTIVAVGHDGSVYSLSVGGGKRVDISVVEEYNSCMMDNNQDAHVTMLKLAHDYGWRYKKS